MESHHPDENLHPAAAHDVLNGFSDLGFVFAPSPREIQFDFEEALVECPNLRHHPDPVAFDQPPPESRHAAHRAQSFRTPLALRQRSYSASVRSAIVVIANSLAARSRAARPMVVRTSSESSSLMIAVAIARESRGGTRVPVLPSTTTSAIPPTREAIVGRPHAEASINATPRP